MKHYHALIVFVLLIAPSVFFSWYNVQATKDEIRMDMSQALAKALDEQSTFEITPDTIVNYCNHLQIAGLRQYSFVYYAQEENKNLLCSRKIEKRNGDKAVEYQCYASCSLATIVGMSNQRLPLTFLLASILWAIGSVVYFNRNANKEFSAADQKPQLAPLGLLAYNAAEGRFYNKNQEAIHLTPMQQQLMRMFAESKNLTLSKQEICTALWPKKPDATDTLYTLVKRIKPIVEEQFGMRIVSDRGRDYSLVDKD